MGAAIGMGGAEIAFAAEGLAESGEDMNTFTSFDGVRIAYHDEGEGPAVILLHGFGVDGLGQFGDFDRILPLLEKRQEKTARDVPRSKIGRASCRERV